MANISIRKLDDNVANKLKLIAARHGISTEEEIRRILTKAVSGPPRIGDLALSLFGDENGIDLELPERTIHEPIDLTK